jgi:Ricin-type beta-trefoil lectin domain-like/Trypsin
MQIWENNGLDPADYVCGGTLIAINWVLTAKHCITDFQLTSVNTEIYIGNLRFGVAQRSVTVEPFGFFLNPSADAALLRLSSSASPGLVVPWGIEKPKFGESATIRAWGSTDNAGTNPATLQTASFSVFDTSFGSEMILQAVGPGHTEDGDSGAGVEIRGLICGIHVGDIPDGPVYQTLAVETAYIAEWIAATSGVLPSIIRTCKASDDEEEGDPPQQPQPVPIGQAPGEFLNHKALLGNIDPDPGWFLNNIPFLECPDANIQAVYYYRWHTYKEHLVPLRLTNGWLSTEFLSPPSYAAPSGGINAAAGHHISEGRWLRDQQYVRGVINYWLKGAGQSVKPQSEFLNPDTSDWAHQYSFWAASAVWQTYLATGDKDFSTALLPKLVTQYRGWDNHFSADLGLYWQIPVWDATEYTPASYESSDPYHGGAGFRPTINAYQYGDATAIAALAGLANKVDVNFEYTARANSLEAATNRFLWDSNRGFYYHMNRDNNAGHALLGSREEQGFLPWMFNMSTPPDSARAFAQLLDPQGFKSEYGPPTAERRSKWFMYEANACCRWDGPSWPFATSQTLTALANLLTEDRYKNNTYIKRNDYVRLLHKYAATQYKDGQPFVAEAHHPDIKSWIYDSPGGGSADYNHSTYVDNVISGLIGVRGQPDNSVIISPLAPASWDYFALENTPYHGHNLTILWDRLGNRYGKGAGLTVLVDGNQKVHNSTLLPVRIDVGDAIIQPLPPPPVTTRVNPGVYQIVNVLSNKLMGVDHEYPFDGAQIQQYEDNGSPDHFWSVEDAGDGNSKIRNIASDLVLGVDKMSTADSALIKQAHDNGTSDHAWQFFDAGGGQLQIVNFNSQLMLGVSGMSPDNSANIVQFHDNGTKDHLWVFKPVNDPRKAVVYKIVNSNSGKVLAVENASRADGAQIQQFADTGTPDHLWEVQDTDAFTYTRIRNVVSGLFLGVDGMSKVDSALIKQAKEIDGSFDSNDHYWQRLGTTRKIKNLNSGLLLGVDKESKADGANIVQFADNGTADHLWDLIKTLDPRTEPFYKIVNVETNKVLAVENESFNDGAQIQQFEDKDTMDQVWQLDTAGYNLYEIHNWHSGLVLGVDGESMANSALIKQAKDNGTADHAWAFIDKGNGEFQIRNEHSGLLLGVSGESQLNSANIVQFSDNGTRDHLWKVVVAPKF